MSTEKVETLVVGGGQAGLAMSEHLSNCGVPHLVLERQRIRLAYHAYGECPCGTIWPGYDRGVRAHR